MLGARPRRRGARQTEVRSPRVTRPCGLVEARGVHLWFANNAMTPESCRALARYNRWMNDKVYTAASKLTEERKLDQGAFFRSIHGTCNRTCCWRTASGWGASPA